MQGLKTRLKTQDIKDLKKLSGLFSELVDNIFNFELNGKEKNHIQQIFCIHETRRGDAVVSKSRHYNAIHQHCRNGGF